MALSRRSRFSAALSAAGPISAKVLARFDERVESWIVCAEEEGYSTVVLARAMQSIHRLDKNVESPSRVFLQPKSLRRDQETGHGK